MFFFLSVEGTKQSPIEAKLVRDGKTLPTKDVDVQISDNKVTFKIKKPTRDQSGQYQIKIGNAQGEDVKDVKLTIQDVPSAPRDVEVKDVFQDSCVVTWKAPEDDGGAPLTKYVIERQDLSLKGGWDGVGEVQPTAKPLTFKCADLVPKKQYRFRIRAVNKLGPSEPGAFNKPVLAKDPWDEPGKPKNVEVTDWDVDHAKLKWEAPDSDGGAPITGYIIEQKEKFAKDWTKAKEITDPNCLDAKVDGLKENGQYEFRVRAVNKAGPGEPSDTTKPIIAKCRFVKPFIIGDGLKNIVVKKNQVIKYDIKYGGEPEPEVKWLKDGQIITEDGDQRITIDKYERNTVLTVRKSARPDTGKYTLTLTNSSGTIDSVADVIVLDRPTPPGGPLVPDEVRADHVKVKWKKPKDTGGSDITGKRNKAYSLNQTAKKRQFYNNLDPQLPSTTLSNNIKKLGFRPGVIRNTSMSVTAKQLYIR